MVEHDELVKMSAKWLKKHEQNIVVPNCTVVMADIKSATRSGEIPDVIGWNSSSSVLIEVKVSKADFRKDKRKAFRKGQLGMGELRYYCAPKGLIKEKELPSCWGLLEYEDGNISITSRAIPVFSNLVAERTMLMSYIRRNK